MRTPVYLDYNATAPMREQAIAVTQEVLAYPRNPSSIHHYGRASRALLERCRKTFADLLSCWPQELIFTASGTEASNMVLKGLSHMPMAISAVEHDAVRMVATNATMLPVDDKGIIEMNALEHFLRIQMQPALICIMMANNETGVIQPIRDIAALTHAYGSLLYVDCVQALGKIPLDLTLLGADIASMSGHKIGGGHGSALLFVQQRVTVPALLFGGGQEFGRRAGTENLAACAAFAAAAEATLNDAWHIPLRTWLNEMEKACIAHFPDERVVFGADAPRLPNTSLLRMPGVASQTQLMQYDLSGFCVSAGSACSSGKVGGSHVVEAMSDPLHAGEVVRVSGGYKTTQKDIVSFGEKWMQLAMKQKERN